MGGWLDSIVVCSVAVLNIHSLAFFSLPPSARHALVHRGKIQKGETLLVTGAGGGMGLGAVQLGVKLGCKVIAAASSEEKLRSAKAAGAHYCINYSNLKELKDRVSQITNGAMADVIYEVVGGDVFKECIRCIAGNGRLLVVGFASGTIPTIPANMVLVKGFSVIGVRSGQEVRNERERERQQRVTIIEKDWRMGALNQWLTRTRPISSFHPLSAGCRSSLLPPPLPPSSFASSLRVRSSCQMVNHPELVTEMIGEMNKIADSPGDRTLAPVVITRGVENFREAYRLILDKKVIGKACVLWQPEEKAKM